MLTLPAELLPLIVEFAPLFSKPVWEHAKVLLVGAILAPGKRTVTACLRVMGLSQEKCFVNYHRVLNRARWSPLAASHILLRLLVTRFAPEGELVFGLDDTIERRRGDKHHRQRHLPRSGAFFSCPFCQSQWLAVALLYGVDQGVVGRFDVGLAFPDGPVSFGTLPYRTGTKAPKADRAGEANHAVAHPLVARSPADLCR